MFRYGVKREVVAVWRWLWQYRRFWRKEMWRVRWWARHFIMSGKSGRSFTENGRFYQMSAHNKEDS